MVTMTERAASEVLELLEKQEKLDHMLRVWIQGGGCSGFQYGMALDNEPADDDERFASHGVTLLVDPLSLPYLTGAEIDFVETVMGGGFKVNNPNAPEGCGGCSCSGDGDGHDRGDHGCGGCASDGH